MSATYTGTVAAPPARGVPERDIWGPSDTRAGIVTLNADLAAARSKFRAWRSDAGRVWATKATSEPGHVPGSPWLTTGCGEALDADNPAAMRDLLTAAGVLPAGPEWLTCAEVGALFGVGPKMPAQWHRDGRFQDGDVILTPGGIRRFRAAAVYAMRAAA